MENNEEKKDQETTEDSYEGDSKQWFRDNLRIIISVLIVVVIAGGIYSYSKRAEAPNSQETEQTNLLEQIAGTDTLKPDENQTEQSAGQEQKPDSSKTQEQAKPQTPTQPDQQSDRQAPRASSTATSQETENSFIETAAKGDGTTKLARQALANYLEKNPDSGLKAEHKIYIEDYLRKQLSQKGGVRIGTSIEFQKSMIQEAITKSKTLNEKQLQNLHKYAVRVPSLS